MKKQLAVLLAALSFLPACSQQSAKPAETADETTVLASAVTEGTQKPVSGHVIPTSETVLPLGRTYENTTAMWMALSGSGAAFTVTGKSCRITMTGDSVAVAGNKDQKARFAVYVDGERVLDEMIERSSKEYTVFEGDTERTAEIRVIKLSESAQSICGIAAIDTDGTVLPAQQKPLKIEFIGDSITCGYGVDDDTHSKTFSTTTEDCTKTYAYKTAEKLGADYSLVSYSGYGICSGYSGDGKQKTGQLVPTYYDKFGFSYTNFDGGLTADSIEWDHTKFEPDIIVINLGTNDASWVKSDEERISEYMEKYDDFLHHIREVHHDSYIICSLGIMGDQLYPYIEKTVENYTSETGDSRVSAFRFDVQDVQADGYATDWHPTEATYEKASDKLVSEIKTLGLV